MIETNEENVDNNSRILMAFEDLLSLLGEAESTLRGASYTLENSKKVLVRTSHILETTPKTFEFKASKEELKAHGSDLFILFPKVLRLIFLKS